LANTGVLRLAVSALLAALLVLVWEPSTGVAYVAVGLGLVLGLALVFGGAASFLETRGPVLAALDALAISLLVGDTGGAGSPFFPLYLLAGLGLVRVGSVSGAVAAAGALVGGYAAAVAAQGIATQAPASVVYSPRAWLGAGLVALSCYLAWHLGVRLRAARREAWDLSEALAAQKRYAARSEALVVRSGPLLAGLGLDEVLGWVAETARELTGAEYAHVALRDGRHRTAVGGDADLYPTWWHPDVQRLAMWSSGEGSVLRVREPLRGVPELAAVPICAAEGEGLGAVIVGGEPLDAEGERILGLLAAGAALALQGAQEALGGRDAITGLPNRSSLYRALGEELHSGSPLAVVLLDLGDELRLRNDRGGFASGDAMLRAVGGGLAQSEQRVFHYGGGVFAVVLRGLQATRARAAGMRLRQSVARLIPEPALSPQGPFVGYVTVGPGEEAEPGSVVAAARGALGQARKGPERVVGAREAGRTAALMGRTEGVGPAASVLLRAIEARDPDLAYHSRAVASLARRVGEGMGLGPAEVEALATGALLHDVGKIGLPDSILYGSHRLSAKEYEIVKRHAELGARIVGAVAELSAALPAVRHHHERMDGRGYPDGLRGEDIPFSARIVHVVDAYDSLVQNRAYRRATSVQGALDELQRHAGTQFDPAVVRVVAEVVAREQEEANLRRESTS